MSPTIQFSRGLLPILIIKTIWTIQVWRLLWCSAWVCFSWLWLLWPRLAAAETVAAMSTPGLDRLSTGEDIEQPAVMGPSADHSLIPIPSFSMANVIMVATNISPNPQANCCHRILTPSWPLPFEKQGYCHAKSKTIWFYGHYNSMKWNIQILLARYLHENIH